MVWSLLIHFTRDLLFGRANFMLPMRDLQKGILALFCVIRYHLKEASLSRFEARNSQGTLQSPACSPSKHGRENIWMSKGKIEMLTTPSKHNIHLQLQLVYLLTKLWSYLCKKKQFDNNKLLFDESQVTGNPHNSNLVAPHCRTHVDDV